MTSTRIKGTHPAQVGTAHNTEKTLPHKFARLSSLPVSRRRHWLWSFRRVHQPAAEPSSCYRVLCGADIRGDDVSTLIIAAAAVVGALLQLYFCCSARTSPRPHYRGGLSVGVRCCRKNLDHPGPPPPCHDDGAHIFCYGGIGINCSAIF